MRTVSLRLRRVRGLFLAAALVVCAVPAWAQESEPAAPRTPQPSSGSDTTDRPFRGLFRSPASRNQTLGISLGAYYAYDDDIFSAIAGGPQAGTSTGPGAGGPVGAGGPAGVYSGVSTGISYARTAQRFSVGVQGGTVSTHRGGSGDPFLNQYSASATVGTSISKRTWSIGANGGVSYAPFYQMSFKLPEGIAELADADVSRRADFSILASRATSTQANLNASRALGARTSLTAGANGNRVDFQGSTPQYQYGISSGVSHRLAPGLSLVAGYGYREIQLDSQAGLSQALHDINAGLSVNRALSVSRRTRFSFSTGSSIFTNNLLLDQASPTTSRKYQFVVTGNAQLTHEMGRTWGASLGYQRSVDFVPGFRQPVLNNVASAGLGGSLSSRAHASVSGFYSQGTVGFDTSSSGFEAYSGSARLTFIVMPMLSAYGEWFIYRYEFDSAAFAPSIFGRSLNRQGARVGTSLSVPIIKSRGRSR